MEGITAVPAWVPLLALIALAALGLAAYTFRRRSIPGALWLTAMNVVVAVYTTTYVLAATMIRSTAALVVLEHFQLALGTTAVGFWFLFILAYTGRDDLLGRRGYLLFLGLMATVFVLDVTGPLHGLVFADVTVDLSGPVPVVNKDSNAVHVVQLVGLFALSPIGIVFLQRLLSEHDRLFSEQAFALLLGSIAPYVAAGIDVLNLEPIPALPLLPLGFGCMSLAVTYAVTRHSLFEFAPATRRIGEARALQQLDDGLVVVAADGTVVQINESACQLLECERSVCLGQSLSELHEVGREGPTDVPDVIKRRGRRIRTQRSTVTAPTGDVMGYTIIYRDVSEKQRQEQRITVLNRILRHNLRNELAVVEGHVSRLAHVDDPERRRKHVDEVRTAIDEIIDISGKAQAVERHLDVEAHTVERLSIAELLSAVVERVRTPEVSITLDVDNEATVVTYHDQLMIVLENLVENAIEHTDSPEPQVRVAATCDRTGATFTITDNGPGIPDHELEALDSGEHSQLYHGSGLGLWLVNWVVDVLDGEIDFSVDDEGTTVRVWVPNAGE